MRQVWIPRYGEAPVLEVRVEEDPHPTSGEVRIKVAGSGVNFADLSARAGLYPDAPPPPMVIGYEVAGTVDEVGDDVGSLTPGERVMAITRFGGYSDTVCVPVHQVVRIHDGADMIAAAGIPVNYLTAYLMLYHLGSLRPGDTVLIHSAGGGVGLAALQLAKNREAIVIGTASSAKHERLREWGLDHAIDYRTQNFETEVKRITAGRGVDIALDAQGGKSFRKSYRSLAPMGRLFCFGMAAANAPNRRGAVRTLPKAMAQTPLFHPLQLMGANKGVFGVNLGHLWEEKKLIGDTMAALASMWATGGIDPVIDQTFVFDDAALAHLHLEKGRNFGKVVLTPT